MFETENKNSEYEMNHRAFHSSLIRLNKNYKDDPWNNIKFIMKSQGFEYKDFLTL